MTQMIEGIKISPDSVRTPEIQTPSLRLILNGQGDGAAMLFDKVIANGHEVVGVVTTTKGVKEGKPDPLRIKATEAGVTIVDLGNVNASLRKPDDPRFLQAKKTLSDLRADLGVGFYLQAMLDNETLNIPEFGTMNTHYSLLPENRGRDAMNRSVLMGEPIGISTFMMNDEVDGGDIVDQTSFPNPDDQSQGALYYRYLEQFVEFVAESVNNMAAGIDSHKKNGTPLPVRPQDHSKATEYPPLSPEDLEVDFTNEPAVTINRKMNAGGPGATTLIEGKKYKIGKPTRLEGPPIQPGRIVEMTDKEVLIEAYQGLIKIGRLQEI